MFLMNFLEWANAGLLSNDEASNYLLSRGVSNEQFVRHCIGFTVGNFSPDPKSDKSHSLDCNNEEKSKQCDTCKYIRWSSTIDNFEGRKIQNVGNRIKDCIVFPLTSYSGNPIGFQVRSLREKSYDTYMVSRRPEAYFFGTSSAIHSVWSSKEVWITEGPVDQLTIERLITPNVLALTTNSVNRQQKKFLDRFIDLVYSCLDLDGAGRSGFKKLLCSDRDFEIRDVKYKRLGFDSKDVNDLWKKIGDDKFKSHLLSCI